MEIGPRSNGVEGILYLKRHCVYDYFQSVIFPGQIEFSSFNRCHVFKMSTRGMASGIDLVNKMRPGGELGESWVLFDFVKRMKDWTTMACHVYNPFLQELQTLAICEFKVEDTEAQVLFWEMLNRVMEKHGFPKAQFKGFMADEAQANWRAVRTVFNGGPENRMEDQERSCLFHWEQSVHNHAKACIAPHCQEEFKSMCRRWKNAPSQSAAEIEMNRLREWWSFPGHANDSTIGRLETWIVWWHARISHWSQYMIEVFLLLIMSGFLVHIEMKNVF